MLFDVRRYTCRPGTIVKHLELYERLGKEPQARNLGKPVLYAKCETGDPNSYLHIWAYESAGDREKKRAAMQADPDWKAYLAESAKPGTTETQGTWMAHDDGLPPIQGCPAHVAGPGP